MLSGLEPVLIAMPALPIPCSTPKQKKPRGFGCAAF
jgi:hypothetical protein